MPRTWIAALNTYSYHVRLSDYKRAGHFPGYFARDIPGDRASTIDFENYFRATSRHAVEPYFEVIFWVLCGQSLRFERSVHRIVDHVLNEGIQPAQLRSAIDGIVEAPTRNTVSELRRSLGIKTAVLTVALTFPAFVDPQRYPMMDMKAADWITANYVGHSRDRAAALTPFKANYTSLRDNDFDNYLNWVHWSRESAEILAGRTNMRWRARDVEMAIFAAARQDLPLNPLP